MDNKGVPIVIVNSFLIYFIFAFDLPNYLINNLYPISEVIAVNFGIGVSLLLYPLFGLLADVYMTRYRMILVSLLSLAILLIFTLICAVGSALALACMIACVRIFEANAVQFGTDQNIEITFRTFRKDSLFVPL